MNHHDIVIMVGWAFKTSYLSACVTDTTMTAQNALVFWWCVSVSVRAGLYRALSSHITVCQCIHCVLIGLSVVW